MIEATKAYRTADGATHASLQIAQQYSIALLIPGDFPQGTRDAIASSIVTQREKFIAILKLKPRKSAKTKSAKPAKAKPAKPKAKAAKQVAVSVPVPAPTHVPKTEPAF